MRFGWRRSVGRIFALAAMVLAFGLTTHATASGDGLQSGTAAVTPTLNAFCETSGFLEFTVYDAQCILEPNP